MSPSRGIYVMCASCVVIIQQILPLSCKFRLKCRNIYNVCVSLMLHGELANLINYHQKYVAIAENPLF